MAIEYPIQFGNDISNDKIYHVQYTDKRKGGQLSIDIEVNDYLEKPIIKGPYTE